MPPDMGEKETTTMRLQFMLDGKVINELKTKLKGKAAWNLGEKMKLTAIPPWHVRDVDRVEIRLVEDDFEEEVDGRPVATVNVIEFADDQPIGLASYPDNKKGNEEAEKRFKAIAKENGTFSDEDLEAYVEDGIVENGTWKAVLFHSTLEGQRPL
jgi:hypothetical protein